MRACVGVCVFVYVCVRLRVPVHVRVRIRVRARVPTHGCVCLRVRAHVRVCTCLKAMAPFMRSCSFALPIQQRFINKSNRYGSSYVAPFMQLHSHYQRINAYVHCLISFGSDCIRRRIGNAPLL